MSFTTKQLQHIEQRTKNIVFGFVRQSQALLFNSNNNSFYPIPDLVIHLFLAFYYIEEYFSKYSAEIQVSGEHKEIITKREGCGTGWDNTSYGHLWHNSMDEIIVKWSFKMNEFNNHTKFSDDDVAHNVLVT